VNTAAEPLRVAIIGCGQIADAHLQEIAKIPGAKVVAVCDREPDLAYQAAARFGVENQYQDVTALLTEARPDVVHVTTPPHTHFPVASQCISSGAHVYVEKPFALDGPETKRLLELAAAEHRLACVGHDHLFDPVWTNALRIVASGELGSIVHIDSTQGYDAGGPFGRLIQADPRHWIHRLPGGIFHNVISHAVCKVTPFITDDRPEVLAMAFGSLQTSSLPTELRVLVRGATTSAYISNMSLARPVRRAVRLFGTRSGLDLDFEGGVIRRMGASALPGAFGRIDVPVRQAVESARNTGRALAQFARSEIQYFAGMRALFTAFYDAIRTSGPPPIAYGEIQRVANLMDDIFAKARCGAIGSLT
jgi:predicted dehydrogenase